MIELNINLETTIEIDFNLKGSKDKPVLRALFNSNDFFIGFTGQDKKIEIPKLTFVQWESEYSEVVVEVLVDDYRVELWKGLVQLSNLEGVFESKNNIKIKVGLIEEKQVKPTITLEPKFL